MSPRNVTFLVIASIVTLTAIAMHHGAGGEHVRALVFPASDQATSPDLAEATGDLSALISQASSDKPLPDRMFSWFTKCDIGLGSAGCTSSPAAPQLSDPSFCAQAATAQTLNSPAEAFRPAFAAPFRG